jgi:hypothetical protein
MISASQRGCATAILVPVRACADADLANASLRFVGRSESPLGGVPPVVFQHVEPLRDRWRLRPAPSCVESG